MGYYIYDYGYHLDMPKIELHYWLKNNSHVMDAYVQNKCELEFLNIAKEIALVFGSEIVIQTEPLAEGGIRRLFQIVAKGENKNATITAAVISAIIISITSTPITTAISKTVEIAITKLFETELDRKEKELIIEGKELDNEGKKLDNEEKKIRNEKSKLEFKEKLNQVETNQKIIKKRSNFYEEIEKDPTVEKLSFIVEDLIKNKILDEILVPREEFKKYILVSNRLDPEPIDNAVIEIISPVLKKGNYKWKGIYDGKAVSLNMKSNEFKTLIQTGKIEFKNGSSIKCALEIEKQLDNDGNETILAYNIIRVNEYFDNDKPNETPEGKIFRQKKEADEKQFKMFDDRA